MNQDNTNIKIFLCYAREDMAIAKRLYADLKCVGVTPWMDTEDLQPEQQWKEVIACELQACDYVLVLLSSGYDEKEATSRFAGKGLAGFLQKPYRAQELIAKVREVLSNR